MDRTLLARLSGALLVIAVALMALSYPWPLFLWGIAPTAVSAVTLGSTAQLVVAGMMLLGLAGLLLAQRSRAGLVGASLALAGLVLHTVVILLVYRGVIFAISLVVVGNYFALFVSRGSSLPLGMADLLAAALFTAGVIYSGLVARRDGTLRLWWAPLALGVANFVDVAFSIVVLRTLPGPSVLSFGAFILGVVAVPLLLWALLGVALLTARGGRQAQSVVALA